METNGPLLPLYSRTACFGIHDMEEEEK